ncbi:hypothetical protein Scep_029784 [Stephania cephalantha]|uniref:Uncharacterized protein n=1 Tax=Stephania cephalantha TaxID=152367 RepID=A0AAP0E1P5_9MAGN
MAPTPARGAVAPLPAMAGVLMEGWGVVMTPPPFPFSFTSMVGATWWHPTIPAASVRPPLMATAKLPSAAKVFGRFIDATKCQQGDFHHFCQILSLIFI